MMSEHGEYKWVGLALLGGIAFVSALYMWRQQTQQATSATTPSKAAEKLSAAAGPDIASAATAIPGNGTTEAAEDVVVLPRNLSLLQLHTLADTGVSVEEVSGAQPHGSTSFNDLQQAAQGITPQKTPVTPKDHP